MKNVIKTTHEKADELLWSFEETGKMQFTVGSLSNECEYQFPSFLSKPKDTDSVKIIPVGESIALSTDEVSIFLFEVLLKVLGVLENNLNDISSDTFKLLYRYNQFLLHKLSVIYPNSIKMQSEYINDKEKLAKLKNILQAKQLDVTGVNTRFLLSTYTPVEKTRELFDVFDDLIYEYTNRDELNPSSIKFNSRTGELKYKNERHSFQRGKDGKMTRLQLFRILWRDKKVLNKGLTKTKGRSHAIDYLASSIDFVLNPSDLKGRKKNGFKELLKGIGRTMKEKKIPLKIDDADETKIQLIFTEG
jgi:hypothetical protein